MAHPMKSRPDGRFRLISEGLALSSVTALVARADEFGELVWLASKAR